MNKDPMSIFIGDSVNYVRTDYYKMMSKTKKLFFESLADNKSTEFFKDEATKIWGNVDHSFMKERMTELEKMVAENNSGGNKIVNPDAVYKEVFKIEPESFYQKYENKYVKDISSYYDKRLDTLSEGYADKNTYLSSVVDKYDSFQANIPYFNKDGSIRSYHNIADYNSMVFNTNLNKSGWNRTNYDADLLGNDLVYLPAHPFACPLCMPYQGQVYSISGKTKGYSNQDIAISGGVGHPNCKHQWTLYWDKSQIQDNDFNSDEWQSKYENKQKARALELERTKLKTDMDIYKKLDNYEGVDKAKSKISLLDSKIKELSTGVKPSTVANTTAKTVSASKKASNVVTAGSYKDVDEAIKGLASKNVNVDLNAFNRMDKDVLTSQLNEIDRLVEKYPTLKNSLISSPLEVTSTPQMSLASYGHSFGDLKKSSLSYSKNNYAEKSVKDIIDRETESRLKGFLIEVDKSSYLHATTTHEMGHLIQKTMYDDYVNANKAIYDKVKERALKAKSTTEINKIIRKFNDDFAYYQNKGIMEVYEELHGTKFNALTEMSKYGRTKHAELFAEAFAQLELDSRNTKLSQALKVFLERTLK